MEDGTCLGVGRAAQQHELAAALQRPPGRMLDQVQACAAAELTM